MRSQLGVAFRRVGVGVPRAGQDGAALDAGLEALLAQRQPFELVQAVAFGRAVHQGVLEQRLAATHVVDRRLPVALRRLFKLPRVAPLVVEEARVVVAFVEVFEDGGEDLGELFGEVDPFGAGLEELAAADGGEEGGGGEDVFVGGEESLVDADAQGDDWGCQVAGVEAMVSDFIVDVSLKARSMSTFPEVGFHASGTSPSSSKTQHGLGRIASACLSRRTC